MHLWHLVFQHRPHLPLEHLSKPSHQWRDLALQTHIAPELIDDARLPYTHQPTRNDLFEPHEGLASDVQREAMRREAVPYLHADGADLSCGGDEESRVLGRNGSDVVCGGDVLLHNGLEVVDIASDRELL